MFGALQNCTSAPLGQRYGSKQHVYTLGVAPSEDARLLQRGGKARVVDAARGVERHLRDEQQLLHRHGLAHAREHAGDVGDVGNYGSCSIWVPAAIVVPERG